MVNIYQFGVDGLKVFMVTAGSCIHLFINQGNQLTEVLPSQYTLLDLIYNQILKFRCVKVMGFTGTGTLLKECSTDIKGVELVLQL